MKDKLKGIIIGFIICTLMSGSLIMAVNTTTLYDVVTNGVKIIIDGKELNATDANGKHVEPIIYNGTTYLPVRAVAGAFEKPVYWDGENYTVYLGNMEGKLEYPTIRLDDMKNIRSDNRARKVDGAYLKDNYENRYTYAYEYYRYGHSEYLLNMKYSRFKGILYIKDGTTSDATGYITVTVDGKTIYTSPEISKISKPIYLDISVKGCNDFKIECTDNTSGYFNVYLADAGFYQ